MKNIVKKIFPAMLMLFGVLLVAFSGCEKDNKKEDNKNIIKIKKATAVIISECCQYPDYNDSISIKLDEIPEGIYCVYPDKPFWGKFREVGLKVVVSGVIDKTALEFNECWIDSTRRILPSNKFIITSIKKQ